MKRFRNILDKVEDLHFARALLVRFRCYSTRPTVQLALRGTKVSILKKYKAWVLLPAVLLGAFLPCAAEGQSMREAIAVLKKLKTRCETGISYSNYPQALMDAKLQVRRFLEGREAGRDPVLAMRLEGILELYEEARLTWGLKFRKSDTEADRFHRGGLLTFADEQDRAIWSTFLVAYPEAEKDIGAGGAVVGGESASVDAMVRMIWNRAAKELKEVESSLPGAGVKPKSQD